MTTRKHLKARVRTRMSRTGERYAVAHAHVVSGTYPASGDSASPVVRGIRHLGGVNPATACLRVLLTHAGLRAADGQPLSEGLVLVIGGGIGAGVFSFRYQTEDLSTLFLAGRHRWDDDLAYLENAAQRLAVASMVRETGGKGDADRNLREALADGPAIAWVDLAELGTRGLPPEWSGGSYHVVVVYEVDDEPGVATLGDLADVPIRVNLADLARARSRITKQRNRVLNVEAARQSDLPDAVRAGIRAGLQEVTDPRRRNFGLDAFRDLADRIHGSTGKESWSRVFPRGRHLFSALQSIHRFVEGYGSGGGLVRVLFAAGLADAAVLTGDERLSAASEQYAALGRAWTDLAIAALPDDVPLLRETRELQLRGDRVYRARGAGALPDLRAGWARLREIEDEVADAFPLSEPETNALLAGLRERLIAIHGAEVAALESLRAAAS